MRYATQHVLGAFLVQHSQIHILGHLSIRIFECLHLRLGDFEVIYFSIFLNTRRRDRLGKRNESLYLHVRCVHLQNGLRNGDLPFEDPI